ncbi:hypothetical protein HMPREF0762_00118 [Slackia exigua ATCC 700122]|uniref:Uncharacterized protein n=1 Tax=Slackia exigua (strain ATCC 700122 / DSM 15923 / CIP 105133 / JCM 11022 / KCTC 5966 / S-7) TaxID=649764 RepID=D0WE93_SLAES|nr:hypothetical protein HMPREF0762_00118 [Slackia exigua ATCC 700122]
MRHVALRKPYHRVHVRRTTSRFLRLPACNGGWPCAILLELFCV